MEGTALEDPVPDAPQHGFVLLHDGKHGLAVANVGLPEYEALRSGAATTLALTLLRCVGWLSRDDLTTRRGGAGPSLPAPEAQLPGAHTFSYSLLPFAGSWLDAVDAAQCTAVALRAVTTPPAEGRLPATGQLVAVEGRGVQVSAVKGAEQGDALVVRLYNVAGQEARATLRLFRPATRVESVTLDERPLTTLHDGEGVTAFDLDLTPHQIVTLRLTF
jgi:alpha-mannosidase